MVTTSVIETDTRLSGAITAFMAEGRDVVFSYHKRAPDGVRKVSVDAENLDAFTEDVELADRDGINVLAAEVTVDRETYATAEMAPSKDAIDSPPHSIF